MFTHENVKQMYTNSALSSCGELLTTYPIDYLKILRQSNLSAKKRHGLFFSNPYRGITSRIWGVIPARMSFWSSLHYSQQSPTISTSAVKSSLVISSCQTIFDYPIEQIKVQRMLSHQPIPVRKCFYTSTLAPGFTTLLFRNFLFMFGYFQTRNSVRDHVEETNYSNKEDKQKTQIYTDVFSISAGVLISQPLDIVKTHIQKSQDTQWNYRSFANHISQQPVFYWFRGLPYRLVSNVMGMMVGIYILDYLKKNH